MNLRDEIWSLEESGCKKPLVIVTIEDDLLWLILLQDAEYIFNWMCNFCMYIHWRFFFPWQGESMDTKLSFKNIDQLAGVNPAISGPFLRDGREGEMKELVWEPAMITVPLSG